MMTTLVLLAVALGVGAWAFGAYNALVRRRNEIANAFAQIDVQLKRRHDLIPNLVETVRAFLQHERQTLLEVTAARQGAREAADAAARKPADASLLGRLTQAESTLQGALGRLMVVVEDYPELKGDQRMRELGEELAHTENRIAFARQAFNDAVLDYNNAAQQAPANVVAAMFGFKPAAMLESTLSEAERQVSAVRL